MLGCVSAEPLREGPLPPSDGLALVLRLLRALSEHVPESRAELAPEAREASLVYLQGIERDVDVVLPFDVVTLAVLRVPLLVRATGLHIASLAAPTRDCAGEFGAPRGWLAVGSFAEEAMAPGAMLGFDTLLCTSRKAMREGDPDVRAVDASSASPPTKLSAFVRERLARRYGRSERWLRALDAAANDARAIDESFVVRVVDDRPRAAPVVRLRHPKFGAGTVVRADGDKVEIVFDSGERKTLMRKFLSDAS